VSLLSHRITVLLLVMILVTQWMAAQIKIPTLESVSPSTKTAGATSFNLTIDGQYFGQGCSVLWNGSPRPTTWVSRTRLVAAIPGTDVASPGQASVKIYKPANNSVSNAGTFTITAPVTVSVSVLPKNMELPPGESQQFTATVTGTTNTGVTWRTSGGSVSARGLFTAPVTPGTYVVTATSVDDLSRTASASVLVPAEVSTQTGDMFAMHMHGGVLARQPWPSVPFGSQRLWDAEVNWADLNPSKGVYRWDHLDDWLNTDADHGLEVLYTFGRTPSWASSQPNDTTCASGPGECDPSNDLNPDGTGINQHWKDFVTAIATHTAGRIKYWEVWNEPSNAWSWTGTHAQMVRMAKDARQIILSIDPDAKIVSPSVGISTLGYQGWMADFLAAGGGPYVDIIGFHGYIQHPPNEPQAEEFVTRMDSFTSMLARYNQGGKPLWDTEGSWGKTYKTGFTSQDKQAGFTARFLLLHKSRGVARFFWYMWNNDVTGTLWQPDPNDPSAPGTLLKPGIAYREVHGWLAGAEMTQACAGAANGTWTCTLRRADGSPAMAVWNTVGNYQFTAPSLYRHSRDVYGAVQDVPTNGVVTIGYKPILLIP